MCFQNIAGQFSGGLNSSFKTYDFLNKKTAIAMENAELKKKFSSSWLCVRCRINRRNCSKFNFLIKFKIYKSARLILNLLWELKVWSSQLGRFTTMFSKNPDQKIKRNFFLLLFFFLKICHKINILVFNIPSNFQLKTWRNNEVLVKNVSRISAMAAENPS